MGDIADRWTVTEVMDVLTRKLMESVTPGWSGHTRPHRRLGENSGGMVGWLIGVTDGMVRWPDGSLMFNRVVPEVFTGRARPRRWSVESLILVIIRPHANNSEAGTIFSFTR
jgi:hypothetical protein